MKTLLLLSMIFLSMIFTISCGGSEDSTKTVCEIGKTSECPCEGNLKGIQVCSNDGKSWGECSCPDPKLKAADVAGTWYDENKDITENSCNLSEHFQEEIKKRSYYKIEDDNTNIELFACKDSTCAEKESGGVYSFKSSIKMNLPNDVMDLGELFEEPELDCKINFKKEVNFVFTDANNGKISSKIITTYEGTDCTEIKAKAEQSDKAEAKDFLKLLNDSCTIKTKADIKKQ